MDEPKDEGTQTEIAEASGSQSTVSESENGSEAGNGSQSATDSKPTSDSADGASAEESADEAKPELVQRRTRWEGFLDACKYLQQLYRDEGVKFRKTDLVSSRFLVASALGLVVLFFVQSGPLSDIVAIVVDVSVALSVVIYIVNRFGILLTLSPRQALLVTEIIIGFSVLVTLLTVNFYYLFFRFLSPPLE